jgi:signal transduction histidine kinase
MRGLPLFGLFFVFLYTAIYVLRARPSHSTNRWFSIFTLTISGWVLGIAGVETGSNTELWGKLTFASASLIPPSFLAFSRAFPTPSQWPRPTLFRAVWFVGLALSASSVATPWVAYGISLTPAGIERQAGPLFPVFSIYFVACVVGAFGIFFVKWHRARGIERAQLQYLGIGLIVLSLGASTTNLVIPAVTGRSHHSWIGPYFAVVLIALVGHAIIRHRLLDLRLVVHRGGAYALFIAIPSVIVVVALRLAPSHVIPSSVTLPFDLVITATVTVVLLMPPGQWLFGRLIDPYLYRNRINYAAELRQATHRLNRLLLPAETADELRSILLRCFSTESSLMILTTSPTRELEQFPSGAFAPEALAECDGVLANLFSRNPAPAVVTINPSRAPALSAAEHTFLACLGFEVAIHLGRRDHRLGTILLGPRRSGDTYFASELEFVESLAEITSIAIDNALLYRQRIEILEYSERLLESLSSAVVAVNISGTITSMNPAATRLLGVPETARGAGIDALPSEVGWALALTLRESWVSRETEVLLDHPERGLLTVILSTAGLHNDPQRTSGALVVATDVSTVRALEHNQRRIEHLSMMARFYAGIAHEIRSPLTSISNFISMLSDRFDDPEYRDTATRLMPLEVSRITALADRLRLMAPSEGGTLTPVDLGKLMRDIVSLHAAVADSCRVRVRLNRVSDVPKVLGDEKQLAQLFLNLLTNALEAMTDGGDIVIDVTSGGFGQPGDFVAVRIIDGGAGISSAIRQKIFDPFFTTKPSGTGLGLSICREIAEFHGARLTLIARGDGPGTMAQVQFPTHPEQNENHSTERVFIPSVHQ